MTINLSDNRALLLVTVFVATFSSLLHQQVARADDRKTASELIKSRGFNVDEFDIVSSQNYPLKAYRIINPLANPRDLHPVPVVCGHGILFNAVVMLAGSSNARPRKPMSHERVTLYSQEDGQDDRSLYFYLSNNNYDVWLVESRGSSGRAAKRMFESNRTINSKNFWEFGLDEQALIDLPAQIDFVRAKTGAPKVSYIGYSQSTSFMFMLLSMEPEFADKLANFIALAPVVYTTHIKGIILPLGIMRLIGLALAQEAAVPTWIQRIVNYALTYTCSISFIRDTLCKGIWMSISGPVYKNSMIEKGLIENPIKQTAVRAFEQYFSNRLFHTFRMYDYRTDELNMQHYGQPVPPQYNVSNIKLRTISLFRGTDDYLSDPADQMILLSKLRVPLYEDHILDGFSHIDFLISPTVVRDVNEPVLRILDQTTDRRVYKVRHSIFNLTNASLSANEDLRQVNRSTRKNATANELRVDNANLV